MDEAEQFLTALQLGDSFFPSGAFAYSSGLETFVSEGLVTGQGTSRRASSAPISPVSLRGATCSSSRLSHRCRRDRANEEIARLDGLAHAMKLAREPRGASMQMGRQCSWMMGSVYLPLSSMPLSA